MKEKSLVEFILRGIEGYFVIGTAKTSWIWRDNREESFLKVEVGRNGGETISTHYGKLHLKDDDQVYLVVEGEEDTPLFHITKIVDMGCKTQGGWRFKGYPSA